MPDPCWPAWKPAMADMPPVDIAPQHLAIVLEILRKHVPDREVWAFGSRARRAAKRYSDLDLAIISAEPLSLLTSARLADDFSESDLPWRVDVLDWATTSAAFRKIVERDKVVLQRAASPPEQRPQDLAETRQDALGADSAARRDEPNFDTSNKAT